MKPKINLSEKQKLIVNAENGPICVKASAGSGKTRVLTERIRFLLKKTDKKVLALTFTNKAGEEIKERLKNIVDIEKRTFIGTFHGFCQSILENHIHLIGYSQMPQILENDADRLVLLEQTINQTPSYTVEYNDKDKKQQYDFCYNILKYISENKRQLIRNNIVDDFSQNEINILLYQNYQDILRSQNAIDFDDLLLLTHKLFVDFPKIASLYRRSFFAICIDEAQDLNNAQYEFFKALTNGKFTNVMMVGDPNQSIFHFIGSSPEYMETEFFNDFHPKVIELTENYRSSKKVLSAAETIIPCVNSIKGIIVKEGIFEKHSIDNENEESLWVINKIKELIALKTHNDIEGEISYEKIVVLARNKYVFKQLEEHLEKQNLPYYYKMTPGAIIFESTLMKTFDLALKVKLNPQDRLHLGQLLNKIQLSKRPTTDMNLNKILKQINDRNIKTLISMILKFDDNGDNFKQELETFRNKFIEENDNEREMIYNDIDELLKHWHHYAMKIDNTSLLQFKNAMALGQTHTLNQHTGITLSTVHTMKGQEFDIVFIIGMDDETFPDYRAIRSGGIEMTQEKNNLYVAFTRSKRFLYVTWPLERKMPWGATKQRKISRFLTSN